MRVLEAWAYGRAVGVDHLGAGFAKCQYLLVATDGRDAPGLDRDCRVPLAVPIADR